MPSVQSTAILAVDYDPASRTLFVRFVDGDLYAYLDVTESAYAAFVDADSKGRHFAEHVRGRYVHHRVR